MGTLLAICMISFVLALVCTYLTKRGGEYLGVLYVPQQGVTGITYTYDGRSLANVKAGKPFEMVVVPGTVTMTSVYTGTTWTDIGCLAYRGSKVGFVGSEFYKHALAELATTHKVVRVSAVIVGYGPEGWPIIQLDLPKREWFAKA